MSVVPETDVVVTGASFTALVTALDLAEVGLSVTVLTHGESPAPEGPQYDIEGTIAAGLERCAQPVGDHAAHGFPECAPTLIAPPSISLRDRQGRWVRFTTPQVFGAPAVPLASDVLRVIGTGAGLRAFVDRVRPVLTIGKTQAFGALVNARLGRRVRELLVDPLVRYRFGAPDVDVAVAVPGLNETLTRVGSLSGAALAYVDRHVARETRVIPAGGWNEAMLSLRRRLEIYGTRFVEGALVSIDPDGDADDIGAGWQVRVAGETEAMLRARGVVIDVDGNAQAARMASGERISILEPPTVRTYASIRIQSPAELSEADREALWLEPVHADGLDQGETFAVTHTDGQWRVELRGPTSEERPSAAEAALVPSAGADDTSSASGRDLIERARALMLRHGYEALPGEEWRLRHVLAPTTSMTASEQQLAAYEEAHDSRPTLVVAGSRPFGGDLSRALAHIEPAAVAMRRRLTGISEA